MTNEDAYMRNILDQEDTAKDSVKQPKSEKEDKDEDEEDEDEDTSVYILISECVEGAAYFIDTFTSYEEAIDEATIEGLNISESWEDFTNPTTFDNKALRGFILEYDDV